MRRHPGGEPISLAASCFSWYSDMSRRMKPSPSSSPSRCRYRATWGGEEEVKIKGRRRIGGGVEERRGRRGEEKHLLGELCLADAGAAEEEEDQRVLAVRPPVLLPVGGGEEEVRGRRRGW